ncbi:family 2 glycosyltransferase [Zopfochytrium polystomum]|nr:family 2 glycosyltransferase [Zopfochytrium polystomum]
METKAAAAAAAAREAAVLEVSAGSDDEERGGVRRSWKVSVGPGKVDGGERTGAAPARRGKRSRTRRTWLCVTWCLTWWIPTIFLRWCCKLKHENKIAWREKVALCIIIALMCGIVLFFIIGLSQILCPKTNVLSEGEIASRSTVGDPYVILYGVYYRIPDIVTDHVNMNGYLSKAAIEAVCLLLNDDFVFLFVLTIKLWQTTLGQDVSAMFYKPLAWSSYCPLPQPPGFDNVDRTIPYAHRTSGTPYLPSIAKYQRGIVARDAVAISAYLSGDPARRRVLRLGGRLYDLTQYVAQSTANASSDFLGSEVRAAVEAFGDTGADAAGALPALVSGAAAGAGGNATAAAAWEKRRACLEGLFFWGVVDERNGVRCRAANAVLLGATAIVCVLIGMKFLAALQLTPRRSPEQHDRFVICQVPCFTEGVESLKKTFESLIQTTYTDSRKLLFVIADGLVTGTGNDSPTPRIVLDILGVPRYVNPAPVAYEAIGEGRRRQVNLAQVYSGWYRLLGKAIPFVVVVKVGLEGESVKPGNRGKRDSQMILMRFLSRIYFDQAMSPLELDIAFHMRRKLGVDPAWFEFVLCLDADTEIKSDAINRLVSSMVQDSKVIGICGETLLSNDLESWVTMIQVYEYFVSHHLSKSFESLFGAVTCLPGCFSMYRIRTPPAPPHGQPLLASTSVLREFGRTRADTLHLKNLLQLGEDRYLTTLMMKHFPGWKLAFVADAQCRTAAPSRWAVLVSQRRRWINSTVHSLLEVARLNDTCGCCCVSMRSLVVTELVMTVVQPSALVYIGYLVYSALTDESFGFPLISLIMIAAVYGAQIIVFILRGQFQHIGWMVIYILATPIYSFYLPLYAFWHFDDFTWGNTRRAVDADGNEIFDAGDNGGTSLEVSKSGGAAVAGKEKQFVLLTCACVATTYQMEMSVPLKTWAEYEEEGATKNASMVAGEAYQKADTHRRGEGVRVTHVRQV